MIMAYAKQSHDRTPNHQLTVTIIMPFNLGLQRYLRMAIPVISVSESETPVAEADKISADRVPQRSLMAVVKLAGAGIAGQAHGSLQGRHLTASSYASGVGRLFSLM